MYEENDFLLLFQTINVYVDFLIIKTNIASNQSRLQCWRLVPPDQIFVLLTVHHNIVVFFGKSTIFVWQDRGLDHLQFAMPL